VVRSFSLDDAGGIILPKRKLRLLAVVRFPNEKEQAEGMTEVPFAVRMKEAEELQKAKLNGK
jgi:hypothetical protein